MLFSFAILCFATLALGDASIHKRMSPGEVQQIFQTTHDTVPDYDVLQFEVSRLIKRGSRSVRSVRILTRRPFGGDMMLWIRPTEGILAGSNTPVFIAKKNVRDEIEYHNYTEGLTNVGQLMEDPAMLASIMVKRSTQGRYAFDGYIVSKELVIRSLPEALSEELTESRKSINKRSAYHVVYRKKTKKKLCELRSLTPNTNEHRKPRADASATRKTPEIPEIIYPKIMLVADSTFHELNNNNINRILAYLVTFWNGVDLLYRRFEEPKFRFNLARIIIAEDQHAVPYIADSMIDPYIYNVRMALDTASRYFYTLLSTFPEKSFDAMFIMSRLEMSDGGFECNILGLSYIRGACLVGHPQSKLWNTAAVTDTGSFDGVLTAAHEFGHLLGAIHDESERCPASDGYLMKPTSEMTLHGHDFSICSVESFQTFLYEDRAVCMYNKPNYTDNPLPRTLPGQLKDRDYQCDTLCGGRNCYDETKGHWPCTAIYCTDIGNNNQCTEETIFGPPDGAYCGKDKICLHGRCILKPKKKTTITTPEAGPSHSGRDRSKSPHKKNDKDNSQRKSDREESPPGKSNREKSPNGKSSSGQNQQGKGNNGQNQSGKSNSGQNQQGKNNGRQNQQGNSNGGQNQHGTNNGGQNQQVNSNNRQHQQGKGNSGQNQSGKSTSGQNQQGKNHGRQNQQGNSNNRQHQQGKSNSGQNQSGKSNSGQNQQGKNNGGQNQHGNSNSGPNQQGKNNGGQNQQGKGNSGQNQQGKNNGRQNQRGNSNSGKNNRGKKGRSASIDIF